MPIPKTQFSKGGPLVTKIGYGAMGISAFYGTTLESSEAHKILDHLVEVGCTFWDTARIYGNNEEIIGEWLAKSGKRDQIFLCTKFGIKPTGVDGSPEYVHQSCAESLERLKTDHIDLFYQHRIDQTIPIEKTVAAMAELVKEGKVKYLGLSECSATTLRRAYKVHPITAVQIEFSPFSTDAETNGLFEACRELGVAVVAYSPLGRGFLTGAYKSVDDLPVDDWRRTNPRFQGENFAKNLAVVDAIGAIGKTKGYTPGQLTLAWIMSKGFVPIPGTTKINRLDENLGAASVELTADEIKTIDEAVAKAEISGSRYEDAHSSMLYADTPEL
ncbi:NADP-dependent oxidoreductase domain-containing protein [Dipodascopsis tothii]|uniref:NADP-dependent oxidoreductase domain-containing protein n=1 Tax=Dipodascopsis tothii TaxID=44089 RepID=UPI0034CF4E75